MNLWNTRAVGILAALALAGAVGCEREAAAQQTQQTQPQQRQQQQVQQPQQVQKPQQAQQRQQTQQRQRVQQPQQIGQVQQPTPLQQIGGGPIGPAQIRQFTEWAGTVDNIQLVNHESVSTGLNLIWASTKAISDQANLYGQPQSQYGVPYGGGPVGQHGFQQQGMQVTPQGYSPVGTIRQQQRTLRQLALALEENDNITQHPMLLRQAAISTVSVFDAMSQVGFPEVSDQVQQVREIAQQIEPNTPIVAQGTKAKDFLEASSQVIEQMSQNIEDGAVGGGPQQGQQQGQQQQGQQ